MARHCGAGFPACTSENSYVQAGKPAPQWRPRRTRADFTYTLSEPPALRAPAARVRPLVVTAVHTQAAVEPLDPLAVLLRGQPSAVVRQPADDRRDGDEQAR